MAYDRWLWRLPWVRKATKKPDLRGTWKGTLQSSFLRNGQPIAPIPVILRVTQTASSINLTSFTDESSSVTDQARMAKDDDGRWKVSWTYSKAPRPTVRDRSENGDMAKRDHTLLGQIERDLLDDRPLADVLRKVIVLGGRAGSGELRDWASLELDGYAGRTEPIPAYRGVAAHIQIDGCPHSSASPAKPSLRPSYRTSSKST